MGGDVEDVEDVGDVGDGDEVGEVDEVDELADEIGPNLNAVSPSPSTLGHST